MQEYTQSINKILKLWYLSHKMVDFHIVFSNNVKIILYDEFIHKRLVL